MENIMQHGARRKAEDRGPNLRVMVARYICHYCLLKKKYIFHYSAGNSGGLDLGVVFVQLKTFF
jgi:hypothetical protein